MHGERFSQRSTYFIYLIFGSFSFRRTGTALDNKSVAWLLQILFRQHSVFARRVEIKFSNESIHFDVLFIVFSGSGYFAFNQQ